jgi:hypothetical protein
LGKFSRAVVIAVAAVGFSFFFLVGSDIRSVHSVCSNTSACDNGIEYRVVAAESTLVGHRFRKVFPGSRASFLSFWTPLPRVTFLLRGRRCVLYGALGMH